MDLLCEFRHTTEPQCSPTSLPLYTIYDHLSLSMSLSFLHPPLYTRTSHCPRVIQRSFAGGDHTFRITKKRHIGSTCGNTEHLRGFPWLPNESGASCVRQDQPIPTTVQSDIHQQQAAPESTAGVPFRGRSDEPSLHRSSDSQTQRIPGEYPGMQPSRYPIEKGGKGRGIEGKERVSHAKAPITQQVNGKINNKKKWQKRSKHR